MSEQEIYFQEQEFNRFETIMNTQEYLTQQEYDFCFGWDKDIRTDTSYIGDYSSYGAYLNLRVYSEYEQDKDQFEIKNGVYNDLPF
jgi:hypothetical protein